MAAGHDREEQVRAERARAIGLFRYGLIRQAADPALSTKQRGRLVRELAEREHPGPFGTPVLVARPTIDRWIRDWRRGGFDALVPSPRRVQPRTPAQVLELAAALKREVPARTAVQIAAILRAHSGWSPDERTLQRHFVRLELNTRPDGQPPQAFGRFEAEAPNVRWTGDALHGPVVGGRKAILFAFVDDHSRLVVGHRWGHSEDTVRLSAALRNALACRGIPQTVYLDNGAAMVDRQLQRACAVLGIRLVHSRPGQPAGRGKIEKFFRTVREQFLVEITPDRPPADLVELNTLFTAWVETVYHRRVHTETEQAPLDRWSVIGTPTLPTPGQLREAFLWSEWRTVAKTATVGLHGNSYEVDAALVGRRVELVFDPFDLTRLQVRWHGRDMGAAVPHRIGRHVHAKARPEPDADPAPAATGIDYLALVAAQHRGTGRPGRLRPTIRPGARHRPGHQRTGGPAVIEKLQSHYGFTRTPFGKSLPPQALHRHASHAEAVARIGWCVRERALGVVTGEVGAGKTVALRAALAGLDSSRHTVIYLSNPAVGGRGLYSGIVTALGGVPRFHKSALIPQTMDLLAAEEHERGRCVVLVLDEAHLMGADQLEELRLLGNAEMDSHSPFAALLVGQPTLRRRIKLGTFAALDQRIALRYAMTGMTREETTGYVRHHLELVGRSDTLFSDDALALIHQVSRGLPRAVNNLAVQALVAAYATNKAVVDESSARAAVTEVTTE